MRTEYLRYFELCYALGNYTTAAKRIPMSRQGLVKAIKSLEATYGVTLFVDDENGALTPTVYADALAEYARLQAMHERELMGRLDHLKAIERKEVRIASSFGIMGHLGDDFMCAFSNAHPDITLTFVEAVDRECDVMVLGGEVDLGLLIAPYPSGCVTSEIIRMDVAMWVNVANPLSERSELFVEDLDGQHIAICGRGFKCYDTLCGRLAESGVAPGALFETSELFRIHDYVMRNRGIGYIPIATCDMPSFRDNESVIHLPLSGFEWRCGISHLSSRRLLEQELAVVDFITVYARNTFAC